jgi:hypothetical protein
VTQSRKRWIKQYTAYSNALNRDREIKKLDRTSCETLNFGDILATKLTAISFVVVGALFALFIMTLVYSGKASTIWATASGTTFREADPSTWQTLLNAWIAKAAQLVLSFCYLAINSECTAMAGAAQWNNLATSHKGLHVTRPGQKS